jgi:hypothetical protein
MDTSSSLCLPPDAPAQQINNTYMQVECLKHKSERVRASFSEQAGKHVYTGKALKHTCLEFYLSQMCLSMSELVYAH